MLLFQRRFHEGILSGAIDRTFRLWPTARVKAGARYRCHPIGVLEVDSVDRMQIGDIGEDDARKAGFSGRSELLEFLAQMARQPLSETVELFLIRFHHGGDGDRVSLALETHLSSEEICATEEKLAKLDKGSPMAPGRGRRSLLSNSSLAPRPRNWRNAPAGRPSRSRPMW